MFLKKPLSQLDHHLLQWSCVYTAEKGEAQNTSRLDKDLNRQNEKMVV